MHVLIASSSVFRRALYCEALDGFGHDVTLADGGVDCVQQVRLRHPDLLLLEAPLLWGGTDGVLELLQEPLNEFRTRVILVAVAAGSIDWFRLSRFHVDDVLFRLPTAPELQRAIGNAPAGITNSLEPAPTMKRDDQVLFPSAAARAAAHNPLPRN
jgi:CheY-like chemotaxis protein